MSRSIQRWVGACVLAAGVLCAACGGRARAGISVGSFATTAEGSEKGTFLITESLRA